MLLLLHPTLQAYASLMVNATAYAYMYMYMGHQPVRNIQSGWVAIVNPCNINQVNPCPKHLR